MSLQLGQRSHDVLALLFVPSVVRMVSSYTGHDSSQSLLPMSFCLYLLPISSSQALWTLTAEPFHLLTKPTYRRKGLF